MTSNVPRGHNLVVLTTPQLELLLRALLSQGYDLIGPTIREGAIVYDHVASTEDLPVGWTDEQQGGKYHLKRREDDAYFGYNLGPHAWKKFLFPPSALLWKAQSSNGHFQILPLEQDPPRYAFIGVRACELQALNIHDAVFLRGPYTDVVYKSRRARVFILAVNCAQAGGTCFCVSMESGPLAKAGYDLSLTELLHHGQHSFVVHAGTSAGAELLAGIPHEPASDSDIAAARNVVEQTARHMGRSLDTNGLKELLYRNSESPRWDSAGDRCLTCANCTMVCPTCFCSTVEDTTDLTGQHAERSRKWDSCFATDFSYIHGGSVRVTPRAKYRQWMMHKLAYWIDQFGTSGCVGCGRCITWCPVGIDITQEAYAIREAEGSANNTPSGGWT